MKKIMVPMFIAILMLCVFPKANVYAVSETALGGITVAGVDVSGKSLDEINSILKNELDEANQSTLLVHCIDDSVSELKPADLGLKWVNKDIAADAVALGKKGNVIEKYKARKDLLRTGIDYTLQYEFDRGLIQAFVEQQGEEYNRDAKNATLEKTEGGFDIVGGQSGVVIDVAAATDYIENYLTTQWNGRSNEITLPLTEEKPKGSEAELSEVRDIIGSYETSFKTSGADRSQNVSNGCRLVDGTLLYPGEEFSMYNTIKPFSVENGYRMAGSYVNGMVVDSLGGGICQVSTTLYNAVLKAELQVIERNNHSMIVSYVDPSADAAISESAGKDFKFVNNTDTPIYIEGYTTPDKHITFNIYGKETRPANRKVEYVSEVLETFNPETENIIPSAEFPVGYCTVQSAHIGYKARLHKIVTVDGKEESREVVNESNYKMVPRTAVVGIATADPEASRQITEAIATGSIDYVRGVSASWAATNAQIAAKASQAQAQAASADGQ